MTDSVTNAEAGGTEEVGRKQRTGIHYAWYMLASAVVINTITSGLGVYGYSAFFKPWETEFGWSRGEISLAMSISGLISGFMSPTFGHWTDRYGSRKVSMAGAVVLGLAFMCMTATGVGPFVGIVALPFLYVMFIVASLGRSGASGIPVSTATALWFVKRRGLAMGIQSSGVGLGGVLVSPLLTFLIAAFGWRVAFMVGGVMVLAIIFPISTFIIRNRPADKGLLAYGLEEQSVASGSAPAVLANVVSAANSTYRWTLREAVRTLPFWCLGLAQGFFYVGNNTMTQHALPLFTEKGESLVVAAGMLSSIAGLGIVGKLASGFIADKLSTARYVHLGSIIFQGVGIAILLFADSTPMYWVAVVVIGLSMGGAVAMQPVMLGECFGVGSFGALLGATSVIVMFGMNFGTLYAGFTHDLTGNYQLALATAIVCEVLGAIAIFLARPAKPASAKSMAS